MDPKISKSSGWEIAKLPTGIKPRPLVIAPTLEADESAIKSMAVAPCRFLLLPGEIRNKIYKLVFETCHYEIKRSKRCRGLTHQFYRMDRPGSWLWYEGRKINSPLASDNFPHRRELAVSLLRTCRQIHDESLSFCYSEASFGFWSRKLLEKFLSTINFAAKTSITRLLIQHETYGDPYNTEDVRWKIVHDLKWETCCERVSRELSGLRNLTVLMKINDRPLILNMTADWATSLLTFEGKGLTHFTLEILSSGMSSHTTPRLRSCARVFERAILGAECTEKDFNRRKDRKLLSKPLPKALRCLIIRW
ncbi:hypothetical protein MMC11_007924 [Xylographa trunciseda]|nr:hypothetical protein [Xylographa trunciseda]